MWLRHLVPLWILQESFAVDAELNLVYLGPAPTYDTARLRQGPDDLNKNNAALYRNSTIALRDVHKLRHSQPQPNPLPRHVVSSLSHSTIRLTFRIQQRIGMIHVNEPDLVFLGSRQGIK